MDQRHQNHVEGSWAAVVAIVALLITCLLLVAYLFFFRGMSTLPFAPSYSPVPLG